VLGRYGLYMMWFSVLLSGPGTLGVAIVYAIRPAERKLAFMRPLSLASIFSAIGSLAAGMATVLHGAAATPAWALGTVEGPGNVGRLLMGCAETLVPVFVTFGLLAVAWLVVALGLRRQA